MSNVPANSPDFVMPTPVSGCVSRQQENSQGTSWEKTRLDDMSPKSADPGDETAEERHVRKALTKARKIAKHLERLGLDVEGNELHDSCSKYPVRSWKFTIPGMHDKVTINPVVTVIGVVCLWSLVIWCNSTFNDMSAVHQSGMRHAHTSLNEFG
jgi:hypothetical protein